MGLFDRFRAPDPADYAAPAGIPDPDAPRDLVLYQYRMCGFCARVRRVIDELDLDEAIATRDTMQDPAARQTLASRTGRTMVPCLFIDDVPMHESADIIAWLRAYAVRGGRQAKTDGSR